MCVAASHSNYSAQPSMLLLLFSALYSVQLLLFMSDSLCATIIMLCFMLLKHSYHCAAPYNTVVASVLPCSQRSPRYYWPDMQISYTWGLDAHWLISTYQLRARPTSVAIGGNCVCVLSSLSVNFYRLLVASLTAGLNIVPITENFSVMSRESSSGNVSGYYRTSVP